jgi:hypothetical protein
MMHRMSEYESSDFCTRYKNGRRIKAVKPEVKAEVKTVFEPKPMASNPEQVNSFRDSFTVMGSGMPQRFNRITEIPQVDSDDVSITEDLITSRW